MYKRQIIDYFQMVEGNGNAPARRVLRPANYPSDMPGWGLYQGQKTKIPYAVINLQGRVFMASNDDPFRIADQLLKSIDTKIILVDFHAEATSEKISMGWYLDGRVSAVVGTHTHVPTCLLYTSNRSIVVAGVMSGTSADGINVALLLSLIHILSQAK